MRIARYIVVGAGAIGASLGAQLARAGRDVVLVARGAHREVLAEKGLEYVTPEGAAHLCLPVAGAPEEIAWRAGDAAIVATKTQDSLPVFDALRRAAGASLPVLCAQNGVENERLALRRFRRVVALAVWIPASFLEPGRVQNYAPHATIELGDHPQHAPGSGPDRLVRGVAEDLCAAGFAAEIRADVMAWKHAKLLTNAVATLDAICGTRAGLDDVDAAIREEGAACYRAAGIAVVPPDEYAARVALAIERTGEIAGVPRAGGSSTQSLVRGLGSIETDYINGELVMLGRRHGVATPVNETIVEIANAMAAKRRAWPIPAAMLRAEVDARRVDREG